MQRQQQDKKKEKKRKNKVAKASCLINKPTHHDKPSTSVNYKITHGNNSSVSNS